MFLENDTLKENFDENKPSGCDLKKIEDEN